MKKIIIVLLTVCVMGVAAPIVPALAGSNVNIKISEGKELKKAGKVTKKSKKSSKEKNTESRLKKLKQLGIPKSQIKYGKDLSLAEMGTIIGNWILSVWATSGQLPNTILNDPPNWLVLNIDGVCVSGPCERWDEE